MANETTISPTTEAKGDIICMSIHMKSLKLVSMNKWIFRALLKYMSWNSDIKVMLHETIRNDDF